MKFFNKLLISLFALILLSSGINAEEGKNLKVAIVNFQRLVVESDLGKQYLKTAKSSIEKKQKILSKLEEVLRNKLSNGNNR